MNDTPELAYRQQILALLHGYRPAQILITCAELGIFTALAAGPLHPGALADALGADRAALERLLNAAVSLGLLARQGEHYANGAAAEACLAAEGPFYLGHLARREGAFYRRWGHLTEAVRSGRRPEENRRDEDQTNWVRDFELALYDIARTAAPAVAAALAPALPGADHPARVIDIGGGHGAYSIALAQRYPRLEAEVFELPAVVPVARELVAAAGVAAQVQVRVGDFKHDALGAGYDLALLFGVLVSETPDDSVALLRKVYAALNPGGAVAVRGSYLDAERTGPPDAVLFDLHQLLSTGAGAAQSRAELDAWLAAAGFAPPETIALPPPDRSLIVLARRPQ